MTEPAPASARHLPGGAEWRRRALMPLVAVALLVTTPLAASAAEEASEASVKAAYLFKFPAFVDWPPSSFASADAPQVIGVMGADDVLASLQQLVAGRRVNGHPLEVRKVSRGDAVDGLHVLFVGQGARPASVAAAVAGQPILVVTDARTGLAEGGALNFLLVDGRVRFEAAPAAAERSGLKLSARLLAVAERVATP